MELDEAITRRRMCRNFTDQAVPADVVDRLLDRASRAPSAGNTQGWSFLVLEGKEETSRFWEANSDAEWLVRPGLPGLMRAPLIVVPLCSPTAYIARYSEPDKIAQGRTTPDAWPAPFWTVDVAFASMILMLEVVQEGLAALFFGLRPGADGRLRAAFDIPEEWQPIGALAIGWPATDWGPRGSSNRGRRPLGEIVHRGRW
jgi:nitroreductase